MSESRVWTEAFRLIGQHTMENALKNTTEYFLKFLFLFESFRLTMDNNFSQMAVSTGHAVAYTFDLIFKHIIECV